LAGQLQQLCLHAGWACDVDDCVVEEDKSTEDRIENDELYRCSIVKTNVNPDANDQANIDDNIVKEKCPVYCLTVPSEVFYVRRNGKACWTGNSRGRGPVTILTRQAPEGVKRDYFVLSLCPSYLTKK